jgi:hypothetical protein
MFTARTSAFGGAGGPSGPVIKQKPSIHDPNTNKNKEYKALNMRHPAGGIIDLQTLDHRGNLLKPEVRVIIYGFLV